MRLTFHGGAGKVTGSNFLIEEGDSKIIVDCGMEQGRDFSEANSYAAFPYDVSKLNAMVLTHAHLDHVGRCPKLFKDGFRGKAYMTPATRDLAVLILTDSINILAQEAERIGRAPLYSAEDVEGFFSLVETLDYHQEKQIAPEFSIYLRNTGHILGSASVRITATDGTTLVLTGDIGNSPSPLLPNWEAVPDADCLVMESVYGDRLHPPQEERVANLRDTFKRAIERGGAILVPAFSIERTQLMLYELSNFFESGELPKVPVFLDSPLAIKVTEVYEKWGPTSFKPEAEEEMKREKSLFKFPFLTETPKRQDSEMIGAAPNPKIIIAGAGMSHGGRIGAHEVRYLPDPKTTLLVVGYQAPGSPGRLIQSNAPSIRLMGHDVPLRAKVENLEGWSAHADRDGLMQFAESALAQKRPKVIFTALGEPSSARFLAQRIHDYLGGKAVAPEMGESWEITKNSVTKI